VIEDRDDIRQPLVELLKDEGFVVHDAADGRTGLELIRLTRPDPALIDIGLPDLDGFEIASQLRADGHDGELRLIAVTGYGQDDDHERITAVGFDTHLIKPVMPDDVVAALAGFGLG
jgi:two-component system CheB/CheR fusion protein